MLGAYPDQTNYDPNRPSWMPYWWDTWDESVNKYAMTINQFSYGNPYGNASGAPEKYIDYGTSKGLGPDLASIAPLVLIVGVGLYAAKRFIGGR